MQAEIITIGDEILLGQTVDSNSAWIGSELADLGIPVYQITSIADTAEHIVKALEEAISRSNLIFVTGGLGPTNDDITKSTLADFFGTTLEPHEPTLNKIKDYFAKRNKEVLPTNIQQAALPKSAKIIPNDHGTAAGMWFEKDNVIVVSMPGVPYEMEAMMSDTILPEVEKQFSTINLYRKTLMTTGIGESTLAQNIEEWEEDIRSKGMNLSYLPSPGIVKLRITSKSETNKEYIENKLSEIENLLPVHAYGREEISIEETVGKLLKANKETVGVVESCTGGNIGGYFTRVPGASDYFIGSLVTYSYAAKEAIVNVSRHTLKKYGAVSEETVKEMALGGKNALQTDYSIATSGIAGPKGGLPDKPVGTVWIAVATPEHVVAKKFQFGTHRQRNITMTTLAAINFLRIEILKAKGDERFKT